MTLNFKTVVYGVLFVLAVSFGIWGYLNYYPQKKVQRSGVTWIGHGTGTSGSDTSQSSLGSDKKQSLKLGYRTSTGFGVKSLLQKQANLSNRLVDKIRILQIKIKRYQARLKEHDKFNVLFKKHIELEAEFGRILNSRVKWLEIKNLLMQKQVENMQDLLDNKKSLHKK